MGTTAGGGGGVVLNNLHDQGFTGGRLAALFLYYYPLLVWSAGGWFLDCESVGRLVGRLCS